MFDTPDPNELATELRSFISAKHSVLGSQVGAFLKIRFPDFDYRTQHINLKRFLHAILPGEVNVIGKSGPDDIMELGRTSSQQPTGLLTNSRDKNTHDQGIEVFRNPTLSGFLIYDPQKKQLLKSAKQVELVEKNASSLLNIERMSHTDQRAIMGEFAKKYSSREDTHELMSLLEGNDPIYWQKFYSAIKSAKLVQSWLDFRRTKVVELLQQRLKDANVPEVDIHGVVTQASLKEASRHNVDALSVSRPQGRGATGPSSLADLARNAITHLSEAQIRELKIPLGAIWDSFQEDI